MHLTSFQKMALLSAALLLAACSGLPAKNYDSKKITPSNMILIVASAN
jgi:hypothetical protein